MTEKTGGALKSHTLERVRDFARDPWFRYNTLVALMEGVCEGQDPRAVRRFHSVLEDVLAATDQAYAKMVEKPLDLSEKK
jgi:hypothetical protein